MPFEDEDIPGSSCYVMPIMVEEDGRQAEISSRLRELGIQTSIFYPSIHEFIGLPRALSGRVAAAHGAGVAHGAHAAVLPHMTDEEQDRVVGRAAGGARAMSAGASR